MFNGINLASVAYDILKLKISSNLKATLRYDTLRPRMGHSVFYGSSLGCLME